MSNKGNEKLVKVDICASVATGLELLQGNLKELDGKVAVVGQMNVPVIDKELEKNTVNTSIEEKTDFDIEFNDRENKVLEGEDEPII